MTTTPALRPCPFCGEQPLTHNGYTRLYDDCLSKPKRAVQVSCSVVESQKPSLHGTPGRVGMRLCERQRIVATSAP